LFPPEKFDFVYSYAVFQHIPSRDVVLSYLREARRVLKTGGVLRCQMNGLPPHAKRYDTWSGVRIAAEEVTRFAREHDMQLLALDGIWTQYMWTALRKMPEGWTQRLESGPVERTANIRNISNTLMGEAVAPAAGPFAALSLWMENLPEECDLNHLVVTAEGRACRMTYIGAPEGGISQVNVILPEGLRTGFMQVEARWLGQQLCAPAWVRIIPPGPFVPRVVTITDGIDLLSGTRIVTRSIKIMMLEVTQPGAFRATVDGRDALDIDSFCADPITGRYEFNFRLPDGVSSGAREVRIALGKREFPPLAIEVE
jgi:Methyltransferase domain